MKRIAIVISAFCLAILSGCQTREEREFAKLEARLDDLEIRINRKAAVYYLREQLTPEVKETVRKGVAAEGSRWLSHRRISLGIHIRNLLRKGDFRLGIEGYDMYWQEILIDALEIQLPQQ
jgi:hypothetical protein